MKKIIISFYSNWFNCDASVKQIVPLRESTLQKRSVYIFMMYKITMIYRKKRKKRKKMRY